MIPSTVTVVIPHPAVFYAVSDEMRFYRGLRELRGRRDLEDTPAGWHLTLARPVDAGTVVDLVALLRRYGVDPAVLGSLHQDASRRARRLLARAAPHAAGLPDLAAPGGLD